MKLLENLLDKVKPQFEKGGKLEKFYYLFDALETFAFVTNKSTKIGSHIRDYMDLKRLMITVVVSLIPCTIFGIYNAGYQMALAAGNTSPALMDCFIQGAIRVVPIIITVYTAGGIVEVIFAIIRGHEINEGFLVTGILIALVMPPTLPLWMVAVGTVFGVLIGKEVFGGTGMNILNPALTARAFVFFAYPVEMSGDKVWVASQGVDAVTVATPLGEASDLALSVTYSLKDAFLGFIPGSIGETSTLCCLIGAFILIITRVGSWRTMLGVLIGGSLIGMVFNNMPQATNPNHMFAIPWYMHLCLGGFAFGMVFMATDPVSSANTNTGKWIFGISVGILAMIIRTINPAYPEGMMLAILFMNVFAPLIDYYVIKANMKRRLARVKA